MNKTLTLTLVLAGVLGFSTSLFAKKKSKRRTAVKQFVTKKGFKRVAVLTPTQKTFKKDKKLKYKKPITKAKLKARKKALKKRRLAKLSKKKRLKAKKRRSKWDRIDFYLLNMGHQENGGEIFQ